MNEDPYWQRAEFLMERGYIPKGTNLGKIAIELRPLDESKTRGTVTNSRDSVYGDIAPLIDKMMDDLEPIEKKLIGESEPTRENLDKA